MTAQTADAPAPDRPAVRRPWGWPEALALGVGLAVLVGVVVRLGTRSALWLDEALSVDIARLPLSQLPDALRQDGAPPLYYVLLHLWTGAFGTGDVAARSLSSLFALLALPLAWLAGRRLHSPVAGTTALLLLASNPFAVRYATETRMYALVVLLVLAGVLALDAALRDPTLLRLAPVAGLSTLLALTHYWALFLLALVGAALLVSAWRDVARAACVRVLAAMAAGGVLFLPWLPVFLFQSAHTGTPWAKPPGADLAVTTWLRWGGPGLWGALLGVLLLVLALVAPLGRAGRDRDGAPALLLRLPLQRVPALLLGAAAGTLLLGIAVSALQPAGFAPRYSSVAFVPGLLAAALGAQALPRTARTSVVALAVALGTVGTLPAPFDDSRTQARETAAVLDRLLVPGDLVLYCPDQLGPAVSRLLPTGTDQLVFPSGGRPQRVDWVDYAQRNAAADPARFAALAARRTDGAVYLVLEPGYRTYGTSCEDLDTALTAERQGRRLLQEPDRHFGERQTLVRYPPRLPQG